MKRLEKIIKNANDNLSVIKIEMEKFEYSKMDNEEFVDLLRDIIHEVERNYKIIEKINVEVNYLVEWCKENG